MTNTRDMSARYDTERYAGATGLNWWTADPTLQFQLRMHMPQRDYAWAAPHLERFGAFAGGPLAERAEQTDRNPPRLERYDRWGHELDTIVAPESFLASRHDIVDLGLSTKQIREAAQRDGVNLHLPRVTTTYLINQAEIGMVCAMGTGGEMVNRMAERYAPTEVRERIAEAALAGELTFETAQSFTERSGGSDLAALETTAMPDGDGWRLDGVKWFVSNAGGWAWVVLARPQGAPAGIRGVYPFLVLRERRDGSRNGVRIRRLKDKLGTKAVASAEVELTGAEAYLLAPPPSGEGPGDGHGVSPMMQLTNPARLAIALMGLGCARRSLVEALCYAGAREAFGKRLTDQPLMRRKLAELVVDVEATQALVYDGYTRPLRLTAPLAKLKAARLGITAASDAIEVHGGNGYCENWPVARILRDAQVNTIWEGPDNILCLDVRRAIEREQAHEQYLPPVDELLERSLDDPTTSLVRRRRDDLEQAIDRWSFLDRDQQELRLWQLAHVMADVLTGALLTEQAGHADGTDDGARKALVAQLWTRNHLSADDPLDAIDDDPIELTRFDELVAGALIDDRGK
jgi:alkylation response protein AidB-like acyl-CoA dehydrogenase